MDLNLLRKMAGIETKAPTSIASTNSTANEFRKLAGLSPLPIKEEPKEEMPAEEPKDEMPADETPTDEMPADELPEIVKQIAAKAEGLEGDELVQLIKQVYDAGVADCMSKMEEEPKE